MKDLAGRITARKIIADEIKAGADAEKAELLEIFAKTGADRVTVTDDDGTKLGVVSRGVGRKSAAVTDEDAFAAWVEANYPESIVKTVDPDFRLRTLNVVKTVGEPVDTATGEVIPGVEVKTGSAYVSARPTPEGKAKIRAALAAWPLLELAGGGTDE